MCIAVGNFAKDNGSVKKDNDYYVSFTDVPTRHKIRELNSTKIGTLLRITGQVVRTHPVHPELVSGTFVCLDCQSIIKDVRQQFKVNINFFFTKISMIIFLMFIKYIGIAIILCHDFSLTLLSK